jgi:hypothetical protein
MIALPSDDDAMALIENAVEDSSSDDGISEEDSPLAHRSAGGKQYSA